MIIDLYQFQCDYFKPTLSINVSEPHEGTPPTQTSEQFCVRYIVSDNCSPTTSIRLQSMLSQVYVSSVIIR